ncbi:hypothetical protein C0993_000327 [Termitomyces sp. T159_Od127]|nr:hypothetical protein C0993_000327 [Termitomyces sp. T159_Od127]
MTSFSEIFLSKLSEIVPLTGFDAICISKDQADGLKGCQIGVSTSSISPSPVALLRARQALYPTELLSAHPGFMDAMSIETRNMITTVLYDSLSELKYHMDKLEALIALELADQYKLRTLDLKSLYQTWNGQTRRMRKGKKGGVRLSGDQETKKVITPKRSLEKGLRLEGTQWTADDIHNMDVVF